MTRDTKPKNIFLQAKESFTSQGIFSTSISEKVFYILAHYATPFFLAMRMSADAITFAGLAFSALSAFAICIGTRQSFMMGLILYGIAVLCDHVDGKVAFARGTITFFGKFYDGLVDVAELSIIRFALVYKIINYYPAGPLLWVSIACLVLTPWHHFIFDRYSAYARWINEEKNTDIKPYIRRNFCLKLASIGEDLERLFLMLSLFFFTAGMWVYFMVNIVLAVFYIFYHFHSASIYMKVKN